MADNIVHQDDAGVQCSLEVAGDLDDLISDLRDGLLPTPGAVLECLEDGAEVIRRLLGMVAWRTMDSAPKDGTEVMLWLGEPWSRVEKARWYEPWANWQCGAIPSDPAREDMCGIGSAVPVLWMYLPSPPSRADLAKAEGRSND